jgi:hypothetical protein
MRWGGQDPYSKEPRLGGTALEDKNSVNAINAGTVLEPQAVPSVNLAWERVRDYLCSLFPDIRRIDDEVSICAVSYVRTC